MSDGHDDTRPAGPAPRTAASPSGADDTVLEGSGGKPPSSGELPFGGAIGRYLVLSVLGRGGMGVVYAAFDPVLDRRIAVKLLHDVVDDDGTEGRTRMRREAQALARLSHPNVITVHDVDEHRGAMYIAMELVDGTTLTEWQRERDWRAIIGAYCSAARGLAAAHAAGLIHRDFKPDNVLVGTDGRVRVTDFGLARLVGGAADAAPAEPSSGSHLAHSVTAAGAVMGTPRYMAPEQIEGTQIDARTDQFSWCVALWEALYGEQPFPTTNLALRAAVIQTDIPKLPAHPEVPRAVGRILLRGIARDPAARWPNLDAVVDELERATAPRRWLVAAVAAACLVALAVGFAIARRGDGAGVASAPRCEDTATAIATVWAPEQRDAVARSFTATGAPFAAGALASLDRAIGSWRERWRAQALENCRATRVTALQSEGVMDLRSACLARRRAELDRLLAELARADAALVEKVRTLELPDLDGCADAAVLTSAMARPSDPAKQQALAALEADLARLETELLRGLSIERARALDADRDALLGRATALGWPAVVARTRQVNAAVQRELGRGRPARATLVHGAAAAAAAGDVDRLLELYSDLIDVETRLTSDYALGESWAALAEGTLARLGTRSAMQLRIGRQRARLASRAGRPDEAVALHEAVLPLARARGPADELEVLADLGLAEGELGKLDDAAAHLGRAYEMARAELGPAHPRLASIEHDLGTIDYRRAKYAEAEQRLRSALAIRTRAYGDASVEVATTTETLGLAVLARGRVAEARDLFARALEITERRLGPEHPDLASVLNAIGGAYHQAGEFERELETNQRALAIREKALGPDHPDVGQSLVNVAIASKALGRWEVVLPNYRRAIAIFTKAHGAGHVNTAVVRLNFAEALRVQGKLDEAAPEYEAARAAFVKELGEEHPILSHVWNGVGQLELARGRAAAAVPLLERAIAIREKDPADPTALAESRFALARALGRTDPRAATLAGQARDAYRAAGASYAKQVAAIEAWLR